MKTNFVPRWLDLFSKTVLYLPVLGLFTQFLGSDYLKQYAADVFINIIESFGAGLINIMVNAIFGTA